MNFHSTEKRKTRYVVEHKVMSWIGVESFAERFLSFAFCSIVFIFLSSQSTRFNEREWKALNHENTFKQFPFNFPPLFLHWQKKSFCWNPLLMLNNCQRIFSTIFCCEKWKMYKAENGKISLALNLLMFHIFHPSTINLNELLLCNLQAKPSRAVMSLTSFRKWKRCK